MAFEIKKEGIRLFRENFTADDFAVKDFRTTSVDLVHSFGTTKGTQWFFDGIKMNYSESVFTEPVMLDWKGNDGTVNMHFNLQGKISIINKNNPDGFELSNNQHNLFYGNESGGKLNVTELEMKIFLVQFSKKTFLDIVTGGNDALKRFADAVAKGEPEMLSEKNLNIDLNLQNCIRSILNCNYPDSLKRMFLFSKSIEMLVLQAECYDRSFSSKEYLKKEYDKERILFARDYLLKNIDCPPTLTELSKIAGINEFKLKKGFKETFHQTVFEYLSDVRMQIAKMELLENKKSITEIAFELGYSSIQHFSSAFRKKYGISPAKVF
jgi:AraC family transcriptional activator of pyochelin receptor